MFKMDRTLNPILEHSISTLPDEQRCEIEATTPMMKNVSDPNDSVPSAAPAPLEQEGDNQATTPMMKNVSDPNDSVPSAAPAPLEQEGDNQDVTSIPMEVNLENWTRPEPLDENNVGDVPRRLASGVSRWRVWLRYVAFFCAICPALLAVFFFTGVVVFLALRFSYQWFLALPILLLSGLLYFYGYNYNRFRSGLTEERAHQEAEAVEDHAV